MGSRWCNQDLPNRDLLVKENTASKYLMIGNMINNLLASNLKTIRDTSLDPLVDYLTFANELQSKLDPLPNILNSSQVQAWTNSLNSKIMSTLGSYLEPSLQTPISGALNLKLVKIINQFLIYGLGLGVKAPNVNLWPGDVAGPYTPLLTNVVLSLRAQFDNELISTGYYVPAGASLKVVVQSVSNVWQVQIGYQVYDLSVSNEYARYPCDWTTRVISKNATYTVQTAFGGLLYFKSPKVGYLNVLVSKVVNAPYFSLADQTTAANFSKQLQTAPGVW